MPRKYVKVPGMLLLRDAIAPQLGVSCSAAFGGSTNQAFPLFSLLFAV
jgi:hypothetical protein